MRSALRLRHAIHGAMGRARPLLQRVPQRPLVTPPLVAAHERVHEMGLPFGGMGLDAARAKEAKDRGELGKRARKFIDAAIACAPLAADALILQVLCKKVKTLVVNYQSETNNASRTAGTC